MPISSFQMQLISTMTWLLQQPPCFELRISFLCSWLPSRYLNFPNPLCDLPPTAASAFWPRVKPQSTSNCASVEQKEGDNNPSKCTLSGVTARSVLRDISNLVSTKHTEPRRVKLRHVYKYKILFTSISSCWKITQWLVSHLLPPMVQAMGLQSALCSTPSPCTCKRFPFS